MHDNETELLSVKQRVLDYVIRQVHQVENFWKYRHRVLISEGISVRYTTDIQIGENEITWTLKIHIPDELIEELVRRIRVMELRVSKEHHKTKKSRVEFESETCGTEV